MTRQHVSETNRDWVMVCDEEGCATASEVFPKQPDLEVFHGRGWFIAACSGDICPACLANGVTPTVEPYLMPEAVTDGHA
ncbi:hypothetical protein OG874_00085 [Nocardia sp. NBC_00565]|uniref:hypothetical protein n=1 Tax=Nocardia sp. NBC_00565 TaxID=2975993 RepID=UPI002E81DC5C|nr:hypothetical protein [Nocardia sp. NBC_00565]WUC03652.1 hypothetical protein OG874_00085 [Nocardia sp. NBC_00565]